MPPLLPPLPPSSPRPQLAITRPSLAGGLSDAPERGDTVSLQAALPDPQSLGVIRPPSPHPPSSAPSTQGRMSDRKAAYHQASYANDGLRLIDGFDSSRDIVGVEADEGAPAMPYLLRVSLDNLKPDAAGNLDVYWLIGTGGARTATTLPDGLKGQTSKPWNLSVAAYDETHFRTTLADGRTPSRGVQYARFDAVRRVVEVALDKAALREAGWKDGEPLTLQPFTAKDRSGKITDSLDAPGRKPWQSSNRLDAAVRTQDAPVPLKARTSDWSGESIYFTLTDRFHNGDRSNDLGADNDLRHYQGGDLRGIIDKLDYIRDLGMTTVWISPTMVNQTRFGNYDGFHGYWPIDFYNVDSRQGDMATMKELVDKAHDRGMKVLLDLPLNQTAWEHPWKRDPSKREWFHHNGDITNWDDPRQVELNDIMGLPDLAQENPAVRDELVRVAKHWIDQTGIDGFRLDAVKHITSSFWPEFSKAIHDHAGPDFLLIGEDLHGAVSHVSRYQNLGLEAMLDFPLYYGLRDSIGSGASMRILADRIADVRNGFDNPRKLGVFIDNHDMNRFISDAARNGGDERRKLKLALALALTIDRVPTIYMGDEVGMDGTQEFDNPERLPYNRKNMEFDRDPEMRTFFSTLGRLRRDSEALREGGYIEAWRDDQVFAFERPSRNGTAFVVLNGSADSQQRDIPVPALGNLKDGTRLRDVLSGQETVVRNGRIPVDVPGRTPRVFMPV